MLLCIDPANLLHEVLKNGLLAVLVSIDLYGRYEGHRRTQAFGLLPRSLVKLEALACGGTVMDPLDIFNTEVNSILSHNTNVKQFAIIRLPPHLP